MKRLGNMRKGNVKQTPTRLKSSLPTIKEESTDMILNRLISGEGARRRKGKGILLEKKQPIQLNSNTWANIIIFI